MVKRRAAVNLPLDNDTYPCERPAIQRAAFACVRAPQRVSDGGVAGFGKFKTGTPALGGSDSPQGRRLRCPACEPAGEIAAAASDLSARGKGLSPGAATGHSDGMPFPSRVL